VTLTAVPDAGQAFVGWAGACTGVLPCAVDVIGPKTVVALFGAPLEFYHLDAIGSVRMVTNMAGTVVKRHDYFAFGEDIMAPTGDPRRFTGKERDAETELHYFGARYYRSLWGRFTSVDPVMDVDEAIVDPQRWNRYSYVTNRPTQFVDPEGRAQERRDHHQDRLVTAWLEGKISKEDYMRLGVTSGPKEIGIVGTAVAVVATVVTVGGGAVITATATCGLTPSCNAAVRSVVEGLAPGARPSYAIPAVTDAKLGFIVRDLYKGALTRNPIGTGSTADAIRYEALTGLPVQGTFHLDKGLQYMNALRNWLRANPNASARDKMVANSLLMDLQNAIFFHGGGS
jgi:RHS repeat-associated protein